MAYALGIYAWFTFILRFAPVKPSFPPTGLEQLGSTFAILLAGGILFIPIRGGVTTSTANVGMVYFSQNQFLNHSAINPCFSLIASLSKQQDFASQFDFYPEEKIKAVTELYDKIGIGRICEEKINAYYAEGLSLLESIAMPSGKKEELKSFVCHLMNRKV